MHFNERIDAFQLPSVSQNAPESQWEPCRSTTPTSRRCCLLYWRTIWKSKYEGFQPRTHSSLLNAFTSAFKELEPIPQFKATAKLGEFLPAVPGGQSTGRDAT